MDQIIAGRFKTKAKADAAAATIVRYIDRNDLCTFHSNLPRQHGTPPLVPASSPVVALAAAGVAAHTESQIGAMGGLGGAPVNQLPQLGPAGVILAIRIARTANEKFVLGDLRTAGAQDIEQAKGDWQMARRRLGRL